MSLRRAVFIDRDGTLNEMVYDENHGLLDSPRRPEQVRMIPGAGAFLKTVRAKGYFICVVTNQPGIAKGTLTLAELDAVNNELTRQLASDGESWDELRFCPHHPTGGPRSNPLHVKECQCRKPKAGLLMKAAEEHNIDLAQSWMIGDGLTDVQAGRRAGCRTILVTTLKFDQIALFYKMEHTLPEHVAANLADAMGLILPNVQVRERSR